jgi:hypothetical protein
LCSRRNFFYICANNNIIASHLFKNMKLQVTIAAICLVLFSCTQSSDKKAEPVKTPGDTVLNASQPDSLTANPPATASSLPFTGKKFFETTVGPSGSGTPRRHIEIMENGDVYFGFIQTNQADGVATEERYFAGTCSEYMKCVFTKLDNEVTYYRITKDKIYLVTENHQPVKSNACCGLGVIEDDAGCPCESGYN